MSVHSSLASSVFLQDARLLLKENGWCNRDLTAGSTAGPFSTVSPQVLWVKGERGLGSFEELVGSLPMGWDGDGEGRERDQTTTLVTKRFNQTINSQTIREI